MDRLIFKNLIFSFNLIILFNIKINEGEYGVEYSELPNRILTDPINNVVVPETYSPLGDLETDRL
jgi:hypothetical protein